MNTTPTIIASTCLLTLSAQVYAAKKISIDHLVDMSLGDLFSVKVDIASKTSEKIFDAPSSVSVFTREEFQAMGVESVEQLLNFVPGFMSSRESVFGQGYMVAARGRTTPQTSYNILFLLNGKRLNNDRSGGALATHHFISLHNVKRVEVIRGPGSALYGTSAFSGVVNIITDNELNEISLRTGSLGQKEASFSLSNQQQDWKWALSARYYADRGDDYHMIDADKQTISDPRRGLDLSAHITYQDLNLDFSYQTRRQDDFYIDESISAGDTHYTAYENLSLRLAYQYLDERDRSLSLYATYQQQSTDNLAETLSSQTLQTWQNQPSPDALLVGSIGKEREWRLGLDGHYRLNKQHELFVGFDWRRPDNVQFSAQSNYTADNMVGLLLGIPSASMQALGEVQESINLIRLGTRSISSLYLQDKYRIDDKWSATLGARYDHYSDFGGTLNPRFSLQYSPDKKTAFKLMYGQAFRAPSIRQLNGFLGNADLKPEKVRTLELAWLQKYHKAQTTLTWFKSFNHDMIDTVLRADGQGREFQNTNQELDITGLEIEATAEPVRGLSLRAAYSYTHQTEQNPRRFPHHSLSMIANYQKANWHFNLNGYYHSSMEQPLAGGEKTTLAAYHVFNARVRYRWHKHTDIFIEAQNLFDKDYYSSVKSVGLSAGLINRGRNLQLGLTHRF